MIPSRVREMKRKREASKKKWHEALVNLASTYVFAQNELTETARTTTATQQQ